jgi:hypothetical protein
LCCFLKKVGAYNWTWGDGKYEVISRRMVYSLSKNGPTGTVNYGPGGFFIELVPYTSRENIIQMMDQMEVSKYFN